MNQLEERIKELERENKLLRERFGKHDGCSRWGVEDSIALDKKSHTFDDLASAIRSAMGYIECGEGETVKFFQDDATKTYHIMNGNHEIVWAESWSELLRKFINQA